MRNVIIVTGTFCGGKTVAAGHIAERLGSGAVQIADVEDFVEIITTGEHGADGRALSWSHFHSWNVVDPFAPHNHAQDESHFPFTVLEYGQESEKIGPRLFAKFGQRILDTVLQKPSRIVVAEFGAGINEGCKTSRANWSTSAWIKRWQELEIWQPLQSQILAVLGVYTDWETRLARNHARPENADGVTASFGIAQECLHVTRHSDLTVWRELGLDERLKVIENNGSEGGFRNSIEGWLRGVNLGPEGQRRELERF